MRNNFRQGKIFESYLRPLIFMAVFFVAAYLVFSVVSSSYVRDKLSAYGQVYIFFILYQSILHEFVVSFVIGVIYGFLGGFLVCRVKSIRTIDKKRLLLWVLPSLVLLFWYILWWVFPTSLIGQTPMVINVHRPYYQIILSFILGLMVAAPVLNETTWKRTILNAAVFFGTLIFLNFAFLTNVGDYSARYTLPEFIIAFLVYGGIGVLFGLVYSLSNESKKSGRWSVDWFRIVIWCTTSFALILYALIPLNSTEGIPVRVSTFLWIFIFGNTITTSIYKKTAESGSENILCTVNRG